jgi:hypothetical protein
MFPMSAHLEADTCVLQVSSGQPQPDEPPGVAVFSAPRKAARGRERDTLFLCLGLRARQPLPAKHYSELLDLATQAFFSFPGSVTSALRQALTVVNQQLLTSNLHAASQSGGLPAQGGLICAVLRGEDFYAVQSGTGMGLVAHHNALERFPTLTSRSLGLSQSPDVQYFHTLVQAEEYFCLCNTVPEGWTDKALIGLGGLTTLTLVLERLKETANSDFAALVGRLEPGAAAPLGLPTRGAMSFKPWGSLFRPRPASPDIESLSTPIEPVNLNAAVVSAAEPLTEGVAPKDLPAEPAEEILTAAPSVEPAPMLVSEPEPLPVEPVSAKPVPAPTSPPASTDWQNLIQRSEQFEQAGPPPSIPIVAEEPAPPPPEEPIRRPPPPLRARAPASAPSESSWQRSFRSFARALAVTVSEGLYSFRKLMARMLPEGMLQRDGLFAVPTSVQIGIAVAIPLLIVSLAAVRYIQRGQAELFDNTVQEAMLEVAAADMEPNPVQARLHWDKAAQWAEQARRMRPADGTVASLWQKAQENLDRLDGVTRVDYRPLLADGLGREAKIKQLLLLGQEVFALDTNGNRILHLSPNAAGTYQLDAAFECSGGGLVGAHPIGTLVSMTLLPQPNPLKADAVLALDNAGRLLYCAPGQKPLTSFLAAPDMGWQNPVALEAYGDRLYVLEPIANEIWQFQASVGTFSQPPTHYFTGAAYDLKSVIDFAIATSSGEIFLLRQDGRAADCDRGSSLEAPTCVEVAQFLDPRPGRGLSERLWDVTQPAHLIYNAPPEPSLYLLDSGNSGLYRLSLKLELVQYFRARQPLSSPITAVASDTARIFVSAGDNVYVANRP